MISLKKRDKNFAVSNKCSNFALAKKITVILDCISCIKSLGYGVMVTLQILVLPFLVRVRVSQPIIQTLDVIRHPAFF